MERDYKVLLCEFIDFIPAKWAVFFSFINDRVKEAHGEKESLPFGAVFDLEILECFIHFDGRLIISSDLIFDTLWISVPDFEWIL
jgi:hypothetical protein